jgi:hypothetical protein
MCVLVIKPDKDGNPCRAKSRIVALGNHEDRYFSKSQRYAPVLKYSSLRLLCSKAVDHKRVLQQGDCKNAFYHAILPEDELTVVRPPIGDPAFEKDEYWLLNKTLYGLRRSPHHWNNMFYAALKTMGLKQSVHDPCLFSGNLTSDPNPCDPLRFTSVFMSMILYSSPRILRPKHSFNKNFRNMWLLNLWVMWTISLALLSPGRNTTTDIFQYICVNLHLMNSQLTVLVFIDTIKH